MKSHRHRWSAFACLALAVSLACTSLHAEDEAPAAKPKPAAKPAMTRAELVACADQQVGVRRQWDAYYARRDALRADEKNLDAQREALNAQIDAYNQAKKRTAQDAAKLKQDQKAYQAALDGYNGAVRELSATVKSLNQNADTEQGACRARRYTLDDALTLNAEQRKAMGLAEQLAEIDKEQSRLAALAEAMPDKEGWIPVDISGGLVRVPVKINGVAATAMIDSGASMNGLSEQFIFEHKDELSFAIGARVQSVFTTEDRPLVNNVGVSLFGAKLRFSDLLPVAGGSFELLLGAPFLRMFVLQIDYPNSRIRLLRHDAVSLKKTANVPMTRSDESYVPLVRVSIAPKEDIWVTLDTGASVGLFLNRKYAANSGMLARYKASTEKAQGVHGEGSIDGFRIPYFKLGPYELEDVAVAVPSERQESMIGRRYTGSLMNPTSKGLVGYDVLKHFVLTLDYDNAEMHLGLPEDLSAKPR